MHTLSLLSLLLAMFHQTLLPPGGRVPVHPLLPPPVITWNGSQTFLFGLNYPWYNYGTDFGTGGWGKYTDWSTISTDFTTMQTNSAHVARWWVFGDGRYDPDFNADGTVSGIDSDVLPNIDQALQIAEANDMYLIFVLMDTAMFAAADDVSGVQLGGHSAIITSPTVQASYINNALIPLVQHIAASPYKKRVIAYDVLNEPESDIAGYVDWGGLNFSLATVRSFVQQCVLAIHQYGAGVYATVGSAEPAYVSSWKGLGLDFYQLHYYSWMDGSGAPGSGLPSFASLMLDKPCIVGEFATVDVSYGLTDTTPLSAEWYLNTIYNLGYAGALAWSLNADDSATDWTDFQPVFAQWATAHATAIGPK